MYHQITNMPDTTFTILYILYKIGNASLVMGFPLLAAAVVTFISSIIPNSKVFGVKVSLYIGLAALLFLSIGAITPNIEEVKAYAVYTICKTTSDTKKAQELIDTVIHYIEDKSTKK